MRRQPEKGPDYPSLGAGVAKWRRLAHEGLSTLSYDDRRAYGLAVLAAIGALQRRELQARLRPTPSTTYSIPRCATKAVNDHKPLGNPVGGPSTYEGAMLEKLGPSGFAVWAELQKEAA